MPWYSGKTGMEPLFWVTLNLNTQWTEYQCGSTGNFSASIFSEVLPPPLRCSQITFSVKLKFWPQGSVRLHNPFTSRAYEGLRITPISPEARRMACSGPQSWGQRSLKFTTGTMEGVYSVLGHGSARSPSCEGCSGGGHFPIFTKSDAGNLSLCILKG